MAVPIHGSIGGEAGRQGKGAFSGKPEAARCHVVRNGDLKVGNQILPLGADLRRAGSCGGDGAVLVNVGNLRMGAAPLQAGPAGEEHPGIPRSQNGGIVGDHRILFQHRHLPGDGVLPVGKRDQGRAGAAGGDAAGGINGGNLRVAAGEGQGAIRPGGELQRRPVTGIQADCGNGEGQLSPERRFLFGIRPDSRKKEDQNQYQRRKKQSFLFPDRERDLHGGLLSVFCIHYTPNPAEMQLQA